MYKKLFMTSLLFIVLLLVMIRISNQRNMITEIEPELEVTPTEMKEMGEVSPTVFEKENNNSDYEIYTSTDMGFSVEHPKNVPVKFYEDGSIGFVIEGPAQKTETEFYDGMVVVFQKMPLEGKTLKTVVEENRAIYVDMRDQNSQISPIKEVDIAGVNGYSFSDITGEYIFLPVLKDSYLSVANLTTDPGKLGYEEIAKKIIDSVKILE